LFSQSDPITLPPTHIAQDSFVKKEEYDDPAFGQSRRRTSLPPPTPGDPVIYGTKKEEYGYDEYEPGPSASLPPPPTRGGPQTFDQEDEYDDDIDDKWMSQIDIGHLEGSSSQVPLPRSSNCKYCEEEKGSLLMI
jgi:hypothetical protein